MYSRKIIISYIILNLTVQLASQFLGSEDKRIKQSRITIITTTDVNDKSFIG
jgi:hypothetical protein